VEGRDGLMTVRPSTNKEGQLAITNVRRERVEGPFTLVDVRIETGPHAPDSRAAGRARLPAAGRCAVRRPACTPAHASRRGAAAAAPRSPKPRCAWWPRRCLRASSLLDAVAGTPVTRDALGAAAAPSARAGRGAALRAVRGARARRDHRVSSAPRSGRRSAGSRAGRVRRAPGGAVPRRLAVGARVHRPRRVGRARRARHLPEAPPQAEQRAR
jgi:hypothetical protein